MRIHFQASEVETAQRALQEYTKRYGQTEDLVAADCIVTLGGDGEALHALQKTLTYKIPVFGINYGHKGFLLNIRRDKEDLIERLGKAESVELNPLFAEATLLDGSVKRAFAVNEFFVCNDNRGQYVYLRVLVDGIEQVASIGVDGIMVTSAVGSSAFNRNAGGPVLPLGNELIVITPHGAQFENRFSPAVLRSQHLITIESLDPQYRKTNLLADARDAGMQIVKADIRLDKSRSFKLMFDHGEGLQERILRTQFWTPANNKRESAEIVKDGMVVDPVLQKKIINRVLDGNFGDEPDQAVHALGTIKTPDGKDVRLFLRHAVDAVLMDRHDNIVLITRKFNPGAGLPALPGGFIDPIKGVDGTAVVEKAVAAALRETTEETGVSEELLKNARKIPIGQRNYNRPFDIREAWHDLKGTDIKDGDFFAVSTQAFLILTEEDLSTVPFKAGDDAAGYHIEKVSALTPEKLGISDHLPMILAAKEAASALPQEEPAHATSQTTPATMLGCVH